jgi:uncharacterized protein YbaR (Trm112 family)
MKCEICEQEFDIHDYGDGACPHCGQQYRYEEGLTIFLSEAQRTLLRDHKVATGRLK